MTPPVPPARPRLLLVLSENWTLASGRDLPELVRWACVAEDAGFDGVMVSEHVVLGPDASDAGVMADPREYALPGNQPPDLPWPSSLLLLAAIAARTSTLRLAAAAVIAPLRHPLLLARELGTLDLLSEGRLVVQPTVSWSRDEYAALGVPFGKRGRILDEQLEVLRLAWAGGPLTFHGEFFAFDDVRLEPRAFRPDGPRLWFGGQRLSPPLLRRLTAYGHGFHPLGEPTADELAEVRRAVDGRDLEVVGGTRATFPDPDRPADLGRAMAPIAEQWAAGFTTFCVKPSQFVDDPTRMSAFCADVVRRAEDLCS